MTPIEAYREARFVYHTLDFIPDNIRNMAKARIKAYEQNCLYCKWKLNCMINDCLIYDKLEESLLPIESEP